MDLNLSASTSNKSSRKLHELPNQIIDLIIRRLDSIDIACCSRVCVSLSLFSRRVFRELLPRLPPLIMFSRIRDGGDSNCEVNQQELVLYSLQSRRFCSIPLPAERQKSWCTATSNGLIMTVGYESPHKIHLINPVSMAQIPLPTLCILKKGPTDSRLNRCCRQIVKPHTFKIITSTSDPLDPDCIFFAIIPYRDTILHCKLGDTKWTEIKNFGVRHGCAVVLNNTLFALTHDDRIAMMKLEEAGSGSKEWFTLELPEELLGPRGRSYLMESCGEVLAIKRQYDIYFKVYKLNQEMKEWMEVKDLGDRALFVGYSSSVSASVSSPSTAALGCCRANCIYVIDDLCPSSDHYCKNMPATFDRGVFDMKTGKFVKWISGIGFVYNNNPLTWIKPEFF